MQMMTFVCVCFIAVCDSRLHRGARFLTCGNKRFNGQVMASFNAVSKTECSAQCLNEKACRSANFITSNKTCELFVEKLMDRDCNSFTTESGSSFLRMENPCKNDQAFDGTVCMCKPPLTGQYCENAPRDCDGMSVDGWFDVYPEDGNGKISIYCQHDHLRMFAVPDGGFTPEYLNSTWNEFKNGFGDAIIESESNAPGAYWLGNENIHRITNGTLSYKLNYCAYVTSSDPEIGNYFHFRIDSEADNYTVHYDNYFTAGSLDRTLMNNCPFRTHDKNDNGCAALTNTGFWFGATCFPAPPILGKVAVAGNKVNSRGFWASLIRK